MASSKLQSAMEHEGDDARMDMSPMIDMVFLLLVFFIVVSTPMVVKMDAEVAPSVAYNAKKPEQKEVEKKEDKSVIVVNDLDALDDGRRRNAVRVRDLDEHAVLREQQRRVRCCNFLLLLS